MIDKTVASATAALADIRDGSTIMIGGFGTAGMPAMLIDALIAQVREIVPLGTLDPEAIVTPGIFVQRVVAATGDESARREAGA